ncbi:MAG: adenylate cyclase [Oscillospiraceae bacterium]|nr:adenylate cyclase [Oscillospiraceae bacterium]
MTKSICLRFNLDKPLHREAWEQLQNMDKEKFKSYSNAVVIAVTDYFQRYYQACDDPYFETREKEDEFVQRVVAQIGSAVEKAMPSFLSACLTGLAQPCITSAPVPIEKPTETEEISEIDLDFIGG